MTKYPVSIRRVVRQWPSSPGETSHPPPTHVDRPPSHIPHIAQSTHSATATASGHSRAVLPDSLTRGAGERNHREPGRRGGGGGVTPGVPSGVPSSAFGVPFPSGSTRRLRAAGVQRRSRRFTSAARSRRRRRLCPRRRPARGLSQSRGVPAGDTGGGDASGRGIHRAVPLPRHAPGARPAVGGRAGAGGG